MATSASLSTLKPASTSLPSTRPANAARASPGPIALAISATVTGPGNDFVEPSGRRMFGIRRKTILVELDADFLHHFCVLVVVTPNELVEFLAGEEKRLEPTGAIQLRLRVGRFERALELLAQAREHRLRRA